MIYIVRELKSDFYNVMPFYPIIGTRSYENLAKNDGNLAKKFLEMFDYNVRTYDAQLDRVMASVVLGHGVSLWKSIPIIMSALFSKDSIKFIKALTYLNGLKRYIISLLKIGRFKVIFDLIHVLPKILLLKFTAGDVLHETLKKECLEEGWKRHPNQI